MPKSTPKQRYTQKSIFAHMLLRDQRARYYQPATGSRVAQTRANPQPRNGPLRPSCVTSISVSVKMPIFLARTSGQKTPTSWTRRSSRKNFRPRSGDAAAADIREMSGALREDGIKKRLAGVAPRGKSAIENGSASGYIGISRCFI